MKNSTGLINLKTVEKLVHCDLCGMKTGNTVYLRNGPYKKVCSKCRNLESVYYYEGANNQKIHKWDLSKLSDKQLKVLLVEPNYYTKFPPLGLLKIATYHRNRKDIVKLHQVKKHVEKRDPYFLNFDPDIIYITSLFTWAWKPVWDATRYYKKYYPNSKVLLGGIYASVLPEHATQSKADLIHMGLLEETENLVPAYDLLETWQSSILFATRGCIRRCSFCIVPKLEGRPNSPKKSISHLILDNHRRVILWDNNILGVENKFEIMNELEKINKVVDFNQGLDARLITKEIAIKLSKLKIPYIHMAYDTMSAKHGVERGIKFLKEAGFRGKNMIFYTLYNHKEDPTSFLDRLQDLMKWGVVSYPMRFEPLNSIKKNKFVAPKWTDSQLKLIAKGRRVLGYGGAFPPYEALVTKILDASTLEEAMQLEEPKENGNYIPLAEYFEGES